jgi:hypothetical protein
MSMQPVPWPEPDPQVAAAVAAIYGARKAGRPLTVMIRDRLGQWLADEQFAAAFGVRGKPGLAPSRLALVTVLQRAEDLTDRGAAEAARARIDWKYLPGLGLDDPGFDHSVLPEFRDRVAAHGLEQVALDALLARLAAEGLVKAAGKQRADSTRVIAAVAALGRLELAGESVRAALEALAAAAPGWVAARVCVPDFARRYGMPMTSWKPPASEARRKELATAYARDGYALLEAVYAPSAPGWLRELPAVDVLRRVLVQNYTRVISADGREVVKRREKAPEGDGLPPGHARIASPYDLDARWGAKRGQSWLGYKLHITETCDDPPACDCGGGAHDRYLPPGPRRDRLRPRRLHHRLRHQDSDLPAGQDRRILVTMHPARQGHHRRHLLPGRLRPLPRPAPVHQRQTPAAVPATPRPGRCPGRRPRQPGHRQLPGRLRPPGRRRGHHAPGRQPRRPPRPLPRPAQDPPRPYLHGLRPQPAPAACLLDRHPARPPPHQPPGTPRTQPRCMTPN